MNLHKGVAVGLALLLIAIMIIAAASDGRPPEEEIEEVDPFTQLPVEFRGGSKLRAGARARPPAGSMFVSLDAGHGFLYGARMAAGQFTGADYGISIPREDELARLVAQRVYRVLDETPRIFPAVSRWIHQNPNSVPDWDRYGPTAGGRRQTSRPWYDLPPQTTEPNVGYNPFQNERSSLYDRARHATALEAGTHPYGKVLVSIHFNAVSGEDGPSVHLQSPTNGSTEAQYAISASLGLAICDELWRLRFGSPSRCSQRLYRRDLAVLREVPDTLPNGQPFPAVLIEVLDLSRTADRDWLGTGEALTANVGSLGDAVARGIQRFHENYRTENYRNEPHRAGQTRRQGGWTP
ncbi:MAG: hypothetical protein ACOY94_10350 [Bacillota bacterium]